VRNQRQNEASDGEEQAQHAAQLVSPIQAQERHEHSQGDKAGDRAYPTQ
jgi:hypothetical protein